MPTHNQNRRWVWLLVAMAGLLVIAVSWGGGRLPSDWQAKVSLVSVCMMTAAGLTMLLRWRSALLAVLVTSLLVASTSSHVTLLDWVEYLRNKSGEPIVLTILVYAGLIALLRREDLSVNGQPVAILKHLESLQQRLSHPVRVKERTVRTERLSEPQLVQSIKQWCLAQRGVRWFLRWFLLLLTTLCTFVASTVTVQSLLPEGCRNDRRRLAALCACVVGPLLVPISAWWLFFNLQLGPDSGIQAWSSLGTVPIACVSYALFSIWHADYLRWSGDPARSEDSETVVDEVQGLLPNRQVGFYITAAAAGLFIALVVVCVYFSSETLGRFNAYQENPKGRVDPLSLVLILVGLLAVMGLMTAQMIYFFLDNKPVDHKHFFSKTTSCFTNSMTGAFGVVAYIVALLALRELLTPDLSMLQPWFEARFEQMSWSWILIVSAVAGLMMGSSFAVVILGLPLLGSGPWEVEPYMIDSLVVVAAWSNQWSFAADNWQQASEDMNETPSRSKWARVVPAIGLDGGCQVWLRQTGFVVLAICIAWLLK